MKVVFVNRFFHPDTSATSQILSDVAFQLAAEREVHVVTSRLRYEVPGDALPARERIAGVEVHRVWTTRFGRTTLAGRAIDYLTFYTSAWWRLARLASRGDVVIAMTDPPLISMPAALAARSRGASVVNWLHDIFPEIASELDFRRWPRWMTRALAWCRDRSLVAARCNVVLGELMQARLRERGIHGDRCCVIPNWASGTEVRPLPRESNPLRREWGLGDEFVVGYVGNMGRVHEFAALVEAARLLAERPDIVFLLVGGGKQRLEIEAVVREQKLANVRFRPHQPRDRLGECLSVPDCHIVSLKPALEGLVVPSKIYSSLAAGRPVIFLGAEDGEIGRLMREEPGFGICVQPHDVEGLMQAIHTLVDDRTRAVRMGETGRRVFERRFDLPIAMARWRALLDQVRDGLERA